MQLASLRQNCSNWLPGHQFDAMMYPVFRPALQLSVYARYAHHKYNDIVIPLEKTALQQYKTSQLPNVRVHTQTKVAFYLSISSINKTVP